MEIKLLFKQEEIKDLIMVLDREIDSDKSFIDDITNKNEKEVWFDEIKRLSNIKDKLEEHLQVVIQEVGLTTEQEDYMIESQLEYLREMREEKR